MAKCTSSKQPDYYWKEYLNGVIPPDAVSMGPVGVHLFVGQVYVHGYGLWVTPIYPNKTFVEFQCHGVRTATKDIKILCCRRTENFHWLRTTAATFNVDTLGKHVVVGGRTYFQNNEATLSIGRVMFDGSLKIGQIPNRRENPLYFSHNGRAETVNNYEVLIYKEF